MNITREKALSIIRSLEDKPRAYADIIEQFTNMANGSKGPFVPGSYNRVRVRDHYYSGWTDKDFKWVLKKVL
jgi:hypothetical protein